MSRRGFLRCIAGGAIAAAGALSGVGCGRAGRDTGSVDEAVPAQSMERGAEEEGNMAAGDRPLGEGDSQAEWDISVCGLNCAKCGLFEGGECGGCRGPLERNWSPGCEFSPCARDRGHRYCFQCEDFPCDKLAAFASDGHEHHRRTVENLKEMRAVGLEEWIARQPRVVFCPGWES